MESNVIAFPKAKRKHPPQSIDEVMEIVVSSRKEHVDIFMENILPLVFSSAADFGFDLSKEESTKSTALFVESLKSSLYDTCGIDHILQDFAEQSFSFIESDYVPSLAPEKSSEEDNSVDINKE